MGRSPAPPHHRRCSEARMLPARPPAPSRTRLRPSRHTELFQVLKILLSLQFLWTAHGCLPLSRCPKAPSWPGVARSPQRLPEGGPRHFGVGPRGAGRVRLGRATPWGLSSLCTLCAKRGCGKPRRPHAAVTGARRCAAQGALRVLGVRLTKGQTRGQTAALTESGRCQRSSTRRRGTEGSHATHEVTRSLRRDLSRTLPPCS